MKILYLDGGWIASHQLPRGESEVSSFTELSLGNKQIIQEIIASTSPDEADNQYDAELLSKLHAFYSSCINEKQLDVIGQSPLLDVVHVIKSKFRDGRRTRVAEKSGQTPFPTVHEHGASDSLTAALAYVHSLGKTHFHPDSI